MHKACDCNIHVLTSFGKLVAQLLYSDVIVSDSVQVKVSPSSERTPPIKTEYLVPLKIEDAYLICNFEMCVNVHDYI